MSKPTVALVCGQTVEAPPGDYFVTCSFDKSHVLLRSRMPYHIIKCIKQHPGHNKLQCPYDAIEYIDPEDFPKHILTCESMRSIVDHKFETAQLKASGSNNVKQTPFFHESAPVPDEDWGGAATVKDKVRNVSYGVESEESFETEEVRGVGRGVSLKKKTNPKRGMGRAELLSHLLKQFHEQKWPGSSNSSCSSESDTSLRKSVCQNQFDD